MTESFNFEEHLKNHLVGRYFHGTDSMNDEDCKRLGLPQEITNVYFSAEPDPVLLITIKDGTIHPAFDYQEIFLDKLYSDE